MCVRQRSRILPVKRGVDSKADDAGFCFTLLDILNTRRCKNLTSVSSGEARFWFIQRGGVFVNPKSDSSVWCLDLSKIPLINCHCGRVTSAPALNSKKGQW